ncbi:hypothetical protein ARMSODRAFT_1088271 [Armillaria solidipes]|uniref:F-box domain-containing protein n=1 Tax=Armillaria solidipes TaxID=1076256 RepID=A0A2H3BA68_9AGAR|nr:hypothetical protein ARMSODRAFT_1088271 [Armillaria solidipes]
MLQQEVVDILNTQSATGLADTLPLELIDTIVEYNRDDKKSLLASSCVSKSWRAASLPHLFPTAKFSSDDDFMRWCDIGSCLPQVPLYVKEVVFEPEVKPIRSLRDAFLDVEDEASWQTRFEALERFVVQNPGITSNPSDFQLPGMPRVHKLVWKTSLSLSVPISCTPETRQFISTFCSLKELKFSGSFATVPHAKEFLGLLPRIEVLDIKAIDIDEAGSSGQSPVFTGDMTKLRKLSVEECEISLDWLVDDILAMSCPTQLQSIRYEHDLPFSPTTFARLVTLSSESLQELIIQPPDRTTPGGWQIPPHFTNKSFPSLTSLTFCIIQLGLPHKPPLFSMNWCRRAVEDLPPALKMTSLTMHFYAVRPEDTDEIVAGQSFDWKQLSERTSELFPQLKKFVIHISMETEFGMRRKALSEALLKERLEHFGNTLVIEWVDENPPLSGSIDWNSE